MINLRIVIIIMASMLLSVICYVFVQVGILLLQFCDSFMLANLLEFIAMLQVDKQRQVHETKCFMLQQWEVEC
jgi:hypothetical protein